MDEDKLPFNWTAGRYISKKETKQQQQLELKIKSLTDSTTINLNIDSNNPDVQSALEDAKIELENAKEELMDAKEELNDELDTAMDDFYSHEHYIFKMVNGELVPLD